MATERKEVTYDGKSHFVSQVDFLMCWRADSDVFHMSEVAAALACVCLNACQMGYLLEWRELFKRKNCKKKKNSM